MDPFLEQPDLFTDFHDSFVAYLREAMQPRLPPPYYAALGRRTWIEVSERFIEPGVQVQRRQPDRTEEQPDAGIGVAVRPRTQPMVIHVPHDERREPLVEIYVGRGSQRRL
jgi:hypothetical protein